jgi:hypothetical protein
VLALLAAGCGSATQVAAPRLPSAVQRHSKEITARLEFPARTLAAGSSMSGRLIVQNDTGRPVHSAGCGTLFQVALTSRTYRPTVAWLTCLQFFTIPVGRSSYRVPVEASRTVCPQGSAHAVRTCPLPPGDYQAVLFQIRQLVRAPRPVPLRVTR